MLNEYLKIIIVTSVHQTNFFNKENTLLQLKIMNTFCSTADYLKVENTKINSIRKSIAFYYVKYFMKCFLCFFTNYYSVK